MLARIGDSSAVVRLGTERLGECDIIAMADTIWNLSTPQSIGYLSRVEWVSWREPTCNKFMIKRLSLYPEVTIFEISDSFACINCPDYSSYGDFKFNGITEDGDLFYCNIDTITGDYTRHLRQTGLPSPAGDFHGYYVSSYDPPEFVIFKEEDPGYEVFSGRYPVFVEWHNSLAYINESPDWDIYIENFEYSDWPGGSLTNDTLEEKWLSYFSPVMYCRDFFWEGALVYAVDGNIVLYYWDYIYGDVFDTVLADVNPTHLGATNVIADSNYSWIFWTDSMDVLWGTVSVSYLGGNIDESPSIPNDFALSAYPN
ncbi:MAG: hypothetical protein ACP5G4_12315, partial [bacterium]